MTFPDPYVTLNSRSSYFDVSRLTLSLKIFFFHRDCIYPVNIRETRVRVCVQALNEYIEENTDYAPEVYLKFYECMIALNVETIDDEFENKEIRRSGKSFSRDYEMLTIEICFLGNSTMYNWQAQV